MLPELLCLVVTHNFWLGVGVGIAAHCAVSVTLCVVLVTGGDACES